MVYKTSREAYWFLYLKLYLSYQQHNQLHFSFCFFNFLLLDHDNPLLSTWWIIYKPRKYYIYIVSSMFVLLFCGFDTFHAQGKMRMVCRTFAIQTLPCYLILNKVMLDLTEEKVCFKGESTMVGTVSDSPVTCCYDVVLIEQYFVK